MAFIVKMSSVFPGYFWLYWKKIIHILMVIKMQNDFIVKYDMALSDFFHTSHRIAHR